jgi:putative FmdB family regulatory protein
MPIYEYRRPDGSTFEVLQSITAEPLTEDPELGVPVERVLHAPAVHFKGSGFYNTDYGTKKRARETKEAGEKGSSSSDSSSSKSESSSASSSKSESTTSSSSSSSTKSD